MKRTILLATKNKDKVTELKQLLGDLPIELVSASDMDHIPTVEEDQETLQGNALKKAREYAMAAGLPALADDTGLEVDALNGEPGVNSARFSGPDATYAGNVRKLLNEMQDVPEQKRAARFRTVIAFVDGDTEHTVDGLCEGTILDHTSGDKGFGYDPVFYYPPLGKTFAEMDTEEKNEISHRGRALVKIKEFLQNYLQQP